MRVLLVWNGPASVHEGVPLIRRQVPLLARLRDQGVAPIVVVLGDRGGLTDALVQSHIPVEPLGVALPPNVRSVPHLPAAVFTLRRVIRRHAPDLVEGDEPMPAIATGLAGRGLRNPIVYRRHHEAARPRLLWASRLAARLADRTMVTSELMRRRASADDGTPLERIDVTRSGSIDTDRPSASDVQELRRSLGIEPEARVIVCVARFRREKGIDVLIGAMPQLADIKSLHLVVVGDGPEGRALRAQAGNAALPVHFAGFRNDVSRYLALANVVAIPSRRETFGRVTLEAMAIGRPIVATRVGGVPEAIADGETGMLVESEDSRALAGALRTVLGDPALAGRLGANARARYEVRFTIDHMATAWREGWERVLAGSRPS